MRFLRVIGAEGRRDALVRCVCAVVVSWAAMYLWTALLTSFLVSALSLDYLRYLKSVAPGRAAFMTAAALPNLLIGLGVGLLFGAGLAVGFRRKPVGVAIASAIALVGFLGTTLLLDEDWASVLDSLGSIASICVPVAAGLMLPTWLLQRRRERVALAT